MAVVKQRLQRFNGSSYDTIHLETEKACITDFEHTHWLSSLNMLNYNVSITNRSALDNLHGWAGVVYVNIPGQYSTVLCFHLTTNSVQLETFAYNYSFYPLMRIRIYRQNDDGGAVVYTWSGWHELVPYDA